MAAEKGKLYGVSVGPGDPELITVRAVRVLGEVDCVAAPDIAGSNRAALGIIGRYIEGKEIVDCASPMTNDRARTAEAYDVVAERIAALLDAGKSVAFVTLGDASVYSTWSYVCERMEGRGYDIEVVAGVTSFCAAAAALRTSLCERSEELVVSPVSTGDTAAALERPGTKVFMKSGRRVGDLREMLRGRGLASSASLVANCGLEGEAVVENLDAAGELPEGMAIVIVKGTADPAGTAEPAGTANMAAANEPTTANESTTTNVATTANEPTTADPAAAASMAATAANTEPSAAPSMTPSASGPLPSSVGTPLKASAAAAQGNLPSGEATLADILASHDARSLTLDEAIRSIAPPDEGARARSFDKWNAVAKPIGSLGVLEDDVMRIAALIADEDVVLAKRAVVVMCADNGVVAEGVTQCGQDVTAAVASNVARHVSSVCRMASCAGIDAFAIDMGMCEPPADEGVVDCSIARGTGNIALGPAMTREQAVRAIEAGIGVVGALKALGYDVIASGEMGIGNTTTSSAVTSVLLGMPVEDVTGRGAGLSDEGLERKIDAIRRAVKVNDPDPADALDVLAKLGGFDIAGLVGLFIGGAAYRVPVVIDGFISALSAYVAKLLCPGCTCAMIASHVSAEPAARFVMGELGVEAAIQAGLRLGEGTGAVCLVPMLDMALALYNGTTFEATGIDAYEVGL